MNDVKPRVHKCKGWVSFYVKKKLQDVAFKSVIIKHLKWLERDESCDNANWVSKGNFLFIIAIKDGVCHKTNEKKCCFIHKRNVNIW